MIKLGIIGTSQGNGHPYSYSAIFNGYNKNELKNNCPYELIREYLPKYHKNKNSIKNAKITHIWTQSKKESYKISKVSRIKNVCNSLNELVQSVDAIILARDDPQNYFKILCSLIKSRKPLFVDKQFIHTKKNFTIFKKILDKNQIFMYGSAMKYSNEVKKRKAFDAIIGKSKSTWLSYGNHLIDGIFEIVPKKIKYVSNKKKDNIENILIMTNENKKINLKFSKNFGLPIFFELKNKNNKNTKINFENYFFIYKKMLQKFIDLINNEKKIKNHHDFFLSKVILAGEISKRKNGKKIYMSSL